MPRLLAPWLQSFSKQPYQPYPVDPSMVHQPAPRLPLQDFDATASSTPLANFDATVFPSPPLPSSEPGSSVLSDLLLEKGISFATRPDLELGIFPVPGPVGRGVEELQDQFGKGVQTAAQLLTPKYSEPNAWVGNIPQEHVVEDVMAGITRNLNPPPYNSQWQGDFSLREALTNTPKENIDAIWPWQERTQPAGPNPYGETPEQLDRRAEMESIVFGFMEGLPIPGGAATHILRNQLTSQGMVDFLVRNSVDIESFVSDVIRLNKNMSLEDAFKIASRQAKDVMRDNRETWLKTVEQFRNREDATLGMRAIQEAHVGPNPARVRQELLRAHDDDVGKAIDAADDAYDAAVRAGLDNAELLHLQRLGVGAVGTRGIRRRLHRAGARAAAEEEMRGAIVLRQLLDDAPPNTKTLWRGERGAAGRFMDAKVDDIIPNDLMQFSDRLRYARTQAPGADIIIMPRGAGNAIPTSATSYFAENEWMMNGPVRVTRIIPIMRGRQQGVATRPAPTGRLIYIEAVEKSDLPLQRLPD
jgi:hypothetical protein